MRFSSAVMGWASAAVLTTGVLGDLRLAAKEGNGFRTINSKGAIKFTTPAAPYAVPSTFGYKGLENQKRNNNDNFLRSNIDNEQDNRNFNNEAGRDHLPFRTLEASQAGPALTLQVGVPHNIPLRWNNPHASECELNVWIADNQVVVPIKKPVCCGEGYQDAVLEAVIPQDFNQLVSKVPGFNGCHRVGDCVLQLYAHSVETRTYVVGMPLIVRGGENTANLPRATDESAIQPAAKDPGTDLSQLPRKVCLPGGDASANIASAVPRAARHVSDVANHAYQNSDYSPYSGQQHEAISRNLQAAAVLHMTVGNRGELGKATLSRRQTQTLNAARNKVNQVYKAYEQTANRIINQIKDEVADDGRVGPQRLANCMRCPETGSVNTNRLQTNTYIPSFEVPQALMRKVANAIPGNQRNLLQGHVVGIYEAALNNPEIKGLFENLAAQGITYQPAVEKDGPQTLAHPTQHRKVNAQGRQDGGVYAATLAYRRGMATAIGN